MKAFGRNWTAIAAAALLALATACAPTETRRAPGETVDDAAITARVKTALIKAPGINATAINVNTYRGEVQLSGFVDNADTISRAVEIARAQPGVRGVTNSLTTAPKR